MGQAEYSILEDNTFYGTIPGLKGVWANEATLSQCQHELQNALEGWILLGLHLHHSIPPINGIDLNPQTHSEVA